MSNWPGMDIPPYYKGDVNALSPTKFQEVVDELEQRSYLARFGISRAPEIVTSTTVLPTIPTVPECGDRRPKLNFHQLIAMAIVHHASRSPTGEDILDWVETHYKYFKQHPLGLCHLRARLRDFYTSYDPPIVPLSEILGHFAMPWEQEQYLSLRYAVVVGHYSAIFPRSPKTFPLMRLPTELRLKVYEYVLGMPCEWLQADVNCLWDQMNRRQNARSGIFSPVRYGDGVNKVEWRGSTYFRCPPVDRILSLLSVSKNVREEAFPIFFRINKFVAGLELCKMRYNPFLKSLGAIRCRYLRSLVITYPTGEGDISIMLAECPELESLDLQIRMNIGEDEDLSQLYDFAALSALRGIKRFRVYGYGERQCARIQAYLEPLVTQPREKPEGAVNEEGPASKRPKLDTTSDRRG